MGFLVSEKTRVLLKNTGFLGFFDEKHGFFLLIRVAIVKGKGTQSFYVELSLSCQNRI